MPTYLLNGKQDNLKEKWSKKIGVPFLFILKYPGANVLKSLDSKLIPGQNQNTA